LKKDLTESNNLIDEHSEIAEETLKKIKERYPEDLAAGFELNDFRGAWKVTFKR